MLELRFLGGCEVRVGGSLVHCSPAPARLLCRLAIDAGHPVPRQRLWEELWPTSASDDVVEANVRRLREVLTASERERVRAVGSSFLLDLSNAGADFLRVRALAEDGSPAALEEVVRLYRGEFLKGCEEAWLLDLRDDLKTCFEDALKTLAEAEIARGDFLAAARHLRCFVASNPDYEWGWHALVETYVRYGNPSEAAGAYAAYADHARENGLTPSDRLEALAGGVREELDGRSVRAIRAESPRADEGGPPTPAPTTPASAAPAAPPVVGGALPPASPYYVARAADAAVHGALGRPGVTVLVKGPRQVGKSSLLARALARCRAAGALVLLTDWQNLSFEALKSEEGFYASLAHKLAGQAGVESDPLAAFRPGLAPGDNFDRFVERLLVPAAGERPVVWAIDEADRIFACPFRDHVFGKLRAWHNDRALDPDGPWRRFSLLLAYSTEAYLFVANLNQSPFNVGTRVTLGDFTRAEVGALAALYGDAVGRGEDALDRLYGFAGGHPYLTSRALYEAFVNGVPPERVEEEATGRAHGGVFADHLERLRFTLGLDPELAGAVRAHLLDRTEPTAAQFLRLCAAGVMTGDSPAGMRPRCALYDRYLRGVLL